MKTKTQKRHSEKYRNCGRRKRDCETRYVGYNLDRYVADELAKHGSKQRRIIELALCQYFGKDPTKLAM